MLKKYYLLIIFLIVIVLFAVLAFSGRQDSLPKSVNNFEECVEAGNLILESYPEQCRAKDGKTFVREIGNELEKADLISVSYPRPNQTIGSPFTIKGEARGFWFFEASFPFRLVDENSNVLVESFIQADGEWMTENFVSFKKEGIVFEKPTTDRGWLMLEKDNPSGLEQNADELRIPVNFK